jgi:phosphatidylserine/phosphatidylglycerophosphate/cardiolipin synthase-like enzyme
VKIRFALASILIFLFSAPFCFALPAEDVRLVSNEQYFKTAQELIRGAKQSIRVIMFEMAYYDKHLSTPTNLLIRELTDAKKRGVKVEVILEVREEGDRTTKRNRRTGKILSDGKVEVIYDSVSRTTHAKILIVDEQLCIVGSTNWTYNALTDNNEVSVLIRSRGLAKELIDYFTKVKTAASNK